MQSLNEYFGTHAARELARLASAERVSAEARRSRYVDC